MCAHTHTETTQTNLIHTHTHTHTHTHQKLPKVTLHKKSTIERALECCTQTYTHTHTHTQITQIILSQKEYYREASGSCGEEGTVQKSASDASGGHRKQGERDLPKQQCEGLGTLGAGCGSGGESMTIGETGGSAAARKGGRPVVGVGALRSVENDS